MVRFPLFLHHHRRLTGRTTPWRSSTSVAVARPFVLSVSRPFRWYSGKLDTHPVMTKCVTAGLIASIGNVSAQKIAHTRQQKMQNSEHEEEVKLDWGSVARFAFLNAAYVAPILHHWYQFVNKAFPGSTMKAVWTRVFYDEFVFTPIYLPVFMGSLWRMEGTEWKRVQHMLVSEMPSIIVADWILWVPTMAITFRYAPIKYQVLVINVVGVVWQTFLSLMANQAHTMPKSIETGKKTQRSTRVETSLLDAVVDDIVFDFYEFNDEWLKQKLN